MTEPALPVLSPPGQRLPEIFQRLLIAVAVFAAVFVAVPARAQVGGAIAVYPQNSTIELGSSRQLSAYVPISPNTVTWAVNEIIGGNSTYGTVSATGFYVPPAVAPPDNILTIKVTSTAYPNSSGAATLKITRKYPWLWGVSPTPSPLKIGNYSVNLNGSNFAPDSEVIANGVALTTTYHSPTKLVAIGNAAAAGPIVFAVRQPGNGMVVGNTVTLQVAAEVLPNVTVAVAPINSSVQVSGTKQFSATVTGSANQAVTWSVNGVNGGSAASGMITAAGLYSAPGTVPSPASVTVRATSVANPAGFDQTTLTISAAPSIPQTSIAAARFLEQTSFGPTPATLADVQQMGFSNYLAQQFAMSETQIPAPANNSTGNLRNWALHNYTTAPDQLRQRVAYSLSQIIVTSANKLIYADEMLPWMRLLSKHAFGNYRTLLRDVTISPSMGKYLDLANSAKPNGLSGANENYARELLQLFTIGLWELNQNGSFKTNASGLICTYDQATVQQVALALTGWVYLPGAYENFTGPMIANESRHDLTSKTFFGTNSPAGLNVNQDLDFLLDVSIKHPNTAPFISTRLIRSLVKSNPSPEYIERVANVFCDDGLGERGNLKAVITAIIMDPEARNDSPATNDGRLKEPILQISGFLRAFNGSISPNTGLTYLYDYMAQMPLAPASVFSWFSPLYRVPKMPWLYGPEFQIYSPSETTVRGNLMYYLISTPNSADFTIDLSTFQPHAGDLASLVEVANQRLLYGRMPAQMKQIIIDAAAPGYDAPTRIATVIYLTALSGQFAVQY